MWVIRATDRKPFALIEREVKDLESLHSELAEWKRINPAQPRLSWVHLSKQWSVQDGYVTVSRVLVEDQLVALFSHAEEPALGARDDFSYLYVKGIEVSPSCRKLPIQGHHPAYLGVGTAILALLVEKSRMLGWSGRLALHSLAEASPFYERIGFERMAMNGNLPYYELSDLAANHLVDEISRLNHEENV